jgi:hypothetical protein
LFSGLYLQLHVDVAPAYHGRCKSFPLALLCGRKRFVLSGSCWVQLFTIGAGALAFELHPTKRHDAATDGVDERLNMSSFVHKFARGMVLVLMLVLTGSANLLCVSVDNDDDDDTPPVSFELTIVAPSLCHLPNGMAGGSRAPSATVKPQAIGPAPSQGQIYEPTPAGFRPLRC